MYRVWYSTESFADYIIDHTLLSQFEVTKTVLHESDANNPKSFHKMPDHIRKILYLDAPDLIVEKDNEPIFSIELTTEAGTGHNVFQRFARIAAAVENNVPAFYIYPEGKIVSRRNSNDRWDKLNPLIFSALESIMSIYDIPALLYYYPSDDVNGPADQAEHKTTQGLIRDDDIINYSGCPDSNSQSMREMFKALNTIIDETENKGVIPARIGLLKKMVIRQQRNFMNKQFVIKTQDSDTERMSPLSAVIEIPTSFLINYLKKYEKRNYQIGELLRNRETSCVYQVNAKFRGDPYPGCLAAIDYLKCREGNTFEDRNKNLIIVFGKVIVDEKNESIQVIDEKGSSVNDFFGDVQNSSRLNLLTKYYDELRDEDKPRYFMQVRYGSTYSKVKHVRVYSYFADAILFPNGSLWRDG